MFGFQGKIRKIFDVFLRVDFFLSLTDKILIIFKTYYYKKGIFSP